MIKIPARVAVSFCVALFLAVLFGWAGLHDLHQHSVLERFSWAATVAGVFLVLPSLYFIFVQVRDLSNSARSSAFEATASRIAAISNAVLEHPTAWDELAVAGTPGTEAQALAEVVLDVIDTELLRRGRLADTWSESLPSLGPWFKDLFNERPGLVHVLTKRRGWYSAEIWDLSQ